MATVTCRQETNAAQQGTERLGRSPQGLDCGTNRLRGGKPKHTWRPEYDAHLKAQYFGGLNRRSRVLNRMTRLTGLPRWRDELAARGVGMSDVFHAGTPGAQFQPDGSGRVKGPQVRYGVRKLPTVSMRSASDDATQSGLDGTPRTSWRSRPEPNCQSERLRDRALPGGRLDLFQKT
jgi:hypothetical protein